MALVDLVARLRLRDDTSGGLASAEGRLTSSFERLRALAAGVGTALAAGLVEALSLLNEIEERQRTLRLATGNRSRGEELDLAELFAAGVAEEDAIAAVATTSGVVAGLPEDQRRDLQLTLAGYAAAGGAPSTAVRGALAFGTAPEDLSSQLNLAAQAALSRDINPAEIEPLLRRGGPAFQAFGLDYAGAADLTARFIEQNIAPRGIPSGLEYALRGADDAGADPVEYLAGVQQQILAASPTEGRLVAYDAFGTEAGAPIAAAIRGGVDFGPQGLEQLVGTPTLPSLNVPSAQDRYAGTLSAAQTRFGAGERDFETSFTAAVGVAGGAVESLPLIGGNLRELIDAPGVLALYVAGSDLDDDRNSRAVVSERLDRIANRIDLSRRRGGSAGALDIPG